MQSVELQVPAELVAPVAALLPGLVAKGVKRLEVFSYGRPGEPAYWVAFVFAGGKRYSVGTPDLRHLSLSDQVPELVRQLHGWPQRSLTEFWD